MSRRLKRGRAAPIRWNVVGGWASGGINAARSLAGRWELLSPRFTGSLAEKNVGEIEKCVTDSFGPESPVPLLCAPVQNIDLVQQGSGSSLVLSGHGNGDVSLGKLQVSLGEAKSDCKATSRKGFDEMPGEHSFSEEPPLRIEYDCAQGKFVDERRIVNGGSCLEQKFYLVPCDAPVGHVPALIELRYFRRLVVDAKKDAQKLLEHQKLRLLTSLVITEAPLMLMVPSWSWFVVICCFHVAALGVILLLCPLSARKESKPDKMQDVSLRPAAKLSTGQKPSQSSVADVSQAPVDGEERCLFDKPGSLRRLLSQSDMIDDVFISVTRARRCPRVGFGNCSTEFEFTVTRNGRSKESWKVWHSYASVLNLHSTLVEHLETDKSQASMFTRLVPAIPQRTSRFRPSVLRTKRADAHLVQRRLAGLQECFNRVFGEKSNTELRLAALSIDKVQNFFNPQPTILLDVSNNPLSP